MGAQNGKDLLVKVDMTADGQFETIAGLRATRVSFNAETVDVTSLESEGGWRELLGPHLPQRGPAFAVPARTVRCVHGRFPPHAVIQLRHTHLTPPVQTRSTL